MAKLLVYLRLFCVHHPWGGGVKPTHTCGEICRLKFNRVLLYSKITSILEKPQPLTENLKVTVGTLLMQKYGYFLIVHTKQENQS